MAPPPDASAAAAPAPAAAAPPPALKPGRTPIDDAVELASRLTALMERENDCLANMDLRGMAALQDEKQQLTRAYCHRIFQIKKDPSRLAAVTQAVRDEIKQVMAKFDETAKANEKVLRSTREANDRVLKVVADAANTLAPRVPVYSRSGAMSRPYGNSRVPTTMPVAINTCY